MKNTKTGKMPNFDRFLCIILVFLCVKNGMLVYVKLFSLSEMPEFCLKEPLPEIPNKSFVPRKKLSESQNLSFGCGMNENQLNLNNFTMVSWHICVRLARMSDCQNKGTETQVKTQNIEKPS